MTNGKAIALLSIILEDLSIKGTDEYPYAFVEAIEKAIKALKEPDTKVKKVYLTTISRVKALDVETNKVVTFKCVKCPNCNKTILFNVNDKYCKWCGQKLDWGEKNA